MTTLDDIWAGDLLSRRSDAEILITFLKKRHAERLSYSQPSGYVINLNAGWGLGKTYFLNRLKKSIEIAGHIAVYVNAWEDDYSSEPMVSVFSSFEAELAPYFKKSSSIEKAWNKTKVSGSRMLAAAGKGAVKRVVKKFIGDGYEDIIEISASTNFMNVLESKSTDGTSDDDISEDISSSVESLLDKALSDKIVEHDERVSSVKQFKSNLTNLIKGIEKHGKSAPIFVLIDELDRCRPTYAISMLEGIKHLFNIPNTIFIVATDSNELSASIKAVYGESFNSKSYLNRFFDRRFTFQEPEVEPFVDLLFNQFNIDRSILECPPGINETRLFSGFAHLFNLSLRDIEQSFDKFQTFVTMWELKSIPIQLIVLYPLIMLYQTGREDEAREFFNARNSLPRGDASKLMVENFNTDDFGYKSNARLDSLENVLYRLRDMSGRRLSEIVSERENSDMLSSWTRRVFQNEFVKLHGNVSTNSGPMSVVRTYYERLRVLGRLSPDGG